MVDVGTGLQGLSFLLKGLKALADIRDEVRRNAAILDLQRQAIELQGHLAATEQDKAALAERVRMLEAEMAELKSKAGDLANYELKGIGSGAVAYMLKPAMRGAEPPHWLCPTCYANGKKAVLQHGAQTGTGHLYLCRGGCGARINVGWNEPGWL